MSSSSLLELEDEGMSMLLSLKELIDGLIKSYSNSLETAEEGTVSVTYAQPSLTTRTMPSIDPQASASTIQVGPEGRFNCDHGAPTHSPPSVGSNSNSSALTPVARSAHSAAGHSPIGREEGLVSLRDLALLNRRKFKVHGDRKSVV